MVCTLKIKFDSEKKTIWYPKYVTRFFIKSFIIWILAFHSLRLVPGFGSWHMDGQGGRKLFVDLFMKKSFKFTSAFS